MTTDDPFAPLREPGLDRLWNAIRKRLENNHTNLTAVPLALKDLDGVEVEAVCGLLGQRRPETDSMKINLRRLDELLRESAVGHGLVEVLEAIGGPIRDRAGERVAKGAARLAVQMETRNHPAVHDPAVERWVESVLRRGRLTRLETGGADPSETMQETLDSVHWLLANAEVLRASPIPLPLLAAEQMGDAHAIDPETPVGALVLDALMSLSSTDDARGAWAAFGVQLDQVSSSVLALNLPGVDASICRAAQDDAQPFRISWRMVERGFGLDHEAVEGMRIRVCENPAIVSLAADHLGTRCAPLICTEGMPGTVTTALLGSLADAGADLRVHADFDFGGVAIVRHLIGRCGVSPWRMSEASYLTACRGPSTDLVREIVETEWDPGLARSMNKHCRAIHEEAVASDLLADLASRG